MKLSIYTLILPRLEVFFLEEWIEHHLMLGVDKIYIYDNGLIPSSGLPEQGRSEYYDKVLIPAYENVDEEERMYRSVIAPESDYFMDYTDTQIYDKLNSIEAKYDEVEVVPWKYMEHHTTEYPESQLTGYRHCVKHNKSAWWLFCDVDEYFVLKKHESFKELINDYPRTTCFHFNQRRFRHRERGVSVREIYKCKMAFVTRYPKTLIIDKIRDFDQHRAKPMHGRVQWLRGENIALFHHYLENRVKSIKLEDEDLGRNGHPVSEWGYDYTMKKYTESEK